MAAYNPPHHPQVVPEARPRASSNASAYGYVPNEYRPHQAPPPPPTQRQSGYFAPARPRGPSIANQQIIPTPPVENYQPQTTTPNMPVPQGQWQLPYPDTSTPHFAPYTPDSRPTMNAYQPSYGSLPQQSHCIHRSNSSASSSSSDEHDRRHSYERPHHGKHHDVDSARFEQKRKKRHSSAGEYTRPTVGDTMYSVFGVIKDALGPRDKY